MKTNTTTTNLANRAAALAAITGGKPEWYTTRKKLTTAERQHALEWDGAAGQYKPAGPGELVRVAGSYATRLHGLHKAAFLSASECRRRGLTPGPRNT